MKKLLSNLFITLFLFQFTGFSQTNSANLYDEYRSSTLSLKFISDDLYDSTGIGANINHQLKDTNFAIQFGSSIDWIAGVDLNFLTIYGGLHYIIDFGDWHLVPGFSFHHTKLNDFDYYYMSANTNTFSLILRSKLTENSIVSLGFASTGYSDLQALGYQYYVNGRATTLLGKISTKISDDSYFDVALSTTSGTTSVLFGLTTTY